MPPTKIGLEIGYRLIRLVDPQQAGPLPAAIVQLRQQFTARFGFAFGDVPVRVNLDLAPGDYRILIDDAVVGGFALQPQCDLAVAPGAVCGRLSGIRAVDPVLGHPAVWVDPRMRALAQAWGYAVVGPLDVLCGQLRQALHDHVQLLIDFDSCVIALHAAARAVPGPLADLLAMRVSAAVAVRAVRGTLQAGLGIHDMRLIAETLAAKSTKSQEAGTLTTYVRIALQPRIVSKAIEKKEKIFVLALAPGLERVLQNAFQNVGDASPGPECRRATNLAAKLRDNLRSCRADAVLMPRHLASGLAGAFRESGAEVPIISYENAALYRETEVVRTVDREALDA